MLAEVLAEVLTRERRHPRVPRAAAASHNVVLFLPRLATGWTNSRALGSAPGSRPMPPPRLARHHHRCRRHLELPWENGKHGRGATFLRDARCVPQQSPQPHLPPPPHPPRARMARDESPSVPAVRRVSTGKAKSAPASVTGSRSVSTCVETKACGTPAATPPLKQSSFCRGWALWMAGTAAGAAVLEGR